MPKPGLTGSRIRAQRLDRGIRQSALAQTLGISSSYLNLIEHNRRRIGGKLLADVARALDTDVASLTEGAEAGLIEALRAAAAGPDGAGAEIDRVEEFAGRLPGWAGLLAAQTRRISALERAVEVLNDRLTHDPFLSASVHEVLSTVTAIRSTSAILVDDPDLIPEWRARFHRNLHEDSRRLAESSQTLVGYLDAAADADQSATTPQEEVEAWMAARSYRVQELEAADGTPEAVLDAAQELRPAARVLAAQWLSRYRADALALPEPRLAAAISARGHDPLALADATQAPLPLVLRRLAVRREGLNGQPVGLVICDGSGTLTFRKPLADFALPRFSSACPLWPLYQALLKPMVPIRQRLELAGRLRRRFTAYAVAEVRGGGSFDAPLQVEATMALIPEASGADVGPVWRVGSSCRICPRPDCAARREPTILSPE
ncbi:XRE family transcriptional regulator [Rhodobacteraceae bacterium CCMM004]|nr:XRE family transcriptional regulator [Rhodobacteraceae bacterium CCMM004]